LTVFARSFLILSGVGDLPGRPKVLFRLEIPGLENPVSTCGRSN
jgi:hypothetical protein